MLLDATVDLNNVEHQFGHRAKHLRRVLHIVRTIRLVVRATVVCTYCSRKPTKALSDVYQITKLWASLRHLYNSLGCRLTRRDTIRTSTTTWQKTRATGLVLPSNLSRSISVSTSSVKPEYVSIFVLLREVGVKLLLNICRRDRWLSVLTCCRFGRFGTSRPSWQISLPLSAGR
jgi:hypothetical protein